MKELFKHVQYILNKYLTISCSISISKLAKDYILLPELYRQANHAITRRFYNGPQSIILYKDIINVNINNDYINELKSEIMDAISHKQFGEIVKLLDTLKQYWEKNPSDDINKVKYVYVSFVEFLKVNYHQELKTLEKNKKIDLTKSITEKFFLKDINDEVKCLIREIASRSINILNNKNLSKNVKEIISFINANYSNEDLGLYTIAEDIGYTNSYLSRLFKNETGMNIVDYINEVRIYKAKQMLKNPNIKVYQVSEKVGYKNYNYFSKIFKKMCGVSPSEYK